MTQEVIVGRFRAGDSMAEMAKDYGVDEKEIEEALRFEQRRCRLKVTDDSGN